MNVITDVQKRVKVGFLCSWLTKMMGHVAGGMLGCGRDGGGREGEGMSRGGAETVPWPLCIQGGLGDNIRGPIQARHTSGSGAGAILYSELTPASRDLPGGVLTPFPSSHPSPWSDYHLRTFMTCSLLPTPTFIIGAGRVDQVRDGAR